MTQFDANRLKEEIERSEYIKEFLIRFTAEYCFNGDTSTFKEMLEDIAIMVDVV